MGLGEPRDRSRAAYPLKRGVAPQGEKNFRGNRGTTNPAFDRLDPGIEPFQVLPLDIPHTRRARCPSGRSESRSLGRSSIYWRLGSRTRTFAWLIFFI